jgi:hypothetical protein
MLVEAASAVALVLGTAGERETVVLRWIGLGLLAMVWASTAAVQVPLHGRLSLGLDRAACRRLVITNWIRTLAWTVRGVIALLIL